MTDWVQVIVQTGALGVLAYHIHVTSSGIQNSLDGLRDAITTISQQNKGK